MGIFKKSSKIFKGKDREKLIDFALTVTAVRYAKHCRRFGCGLRVVAAEVHTSEYQKIVALKIAKFSDWGDKEELIPELFISEDRLFGGESFMSIKEYRKLLKTSDTSRAERWENLKDGWKELI